MWRDIKTLSIYLSIYLSTSDGMVLAHLFSSCRNCMPEFTWEKLVAMKPHSCSSSSVTWRWNSPKSTANSILRWSRGLYGFLLKAETRWLKCVARDSFPSMWDCWSTENCCMVSTRLRIWSRRWQKDANLPKTYISEISNGDGCCTRAAYSGWNIPGSTGRVSCKHPASGGVWLEGHPRHVHVPLLWCTACKQTPSGWSPTREELTLNRPLTWAIIMQQYVALHKANLQ